MGLPDGREAIKASESIFSTNVLRIGTSGRNEEHLSIVDMLGIFKNTTEGRKIKADTTLERKVVEGYIENPRLVMLTVIPTNVDVTTQKILELAHDVDPEGQRTLEVLTKLERHSHGKFINTG